MKKWLLVMALALATATASAGEPLSTEHERKQRIFDGVTVGDAVTTIIGAGCVAVKEVNPLLQGASPAGIVGFFVIRNVLHQKITESIPEEWRTAWLNTSIGAQSVVVVNNVAVLSKYC
jgi:dihydrodipicolinate synthase/N-acetylneuraminate lyase